MAVALLLVGCHRNPATKAIVAQVPSASAGPSAAHVEASRLPEDAAAGKASEAQWRTHMEAEERERQLAFDHERLKEHHALVAVIEDARSRYDRARTESQVQRARSDMPRRLAEIRRRVTELDHWGNNSRLLPEYDALAKSLAGPYADAKSAALQGDARALTEASADFDRRLHAIDEWLEEAKNVDENHEQN